MNETQLILQAVRPYPYQVVKQRPGQIKLL